MTASFDNLHDAKGKLENTYAYYDGKACVVKEINMDERPGKFQVTVALHNDIKRFPLEDPAFNYTTYNLGYANSNISCVWWGRLAKRQFVQGLKQQQVNYVATSPFAAREASFQFGKPIRNMLENAYPSFEEVLKLLDARPDIISRAFHVDFALTRNGDEEKYFIEYCGNYVGVYKPKTKEVCLNKQYNHLSEYLHEALNG